MAPPDIKPAVDLSYHAKQSLGYAGLLAGALGAALIARVGFRTVFPKKQGAGGPKGSRDQLVPRGGGGSRMVAPAGPTGMMPSAGGPPTEEPSNADMVQRLLQMCGPEMQARQPLNPNVVRAFLQLHAIAADVPPVLRLEVADLLDYQLMRTVGVFLSTRRSQQQVAQQQLTMHQQTRMLGLIACKWLDFSDDALASLDPEGLNKLYIMLLDAGRRSGQEFTWLDRAFDFFEPDVSEILGRAPGAPLGEKMLRAAAVLGRFDEMAEWYELVRGTKIEKEMELLVQVFGCAVNVPTLMLLWLLAQNGSDATASLRKAFAAAKALDLTKTNGLVYVLDGTLAKVEPAEGAAAAAAPAAADAAKDEGASAAEDKAADADADAAAAAAKDEGAADKASGDAAEDADADADAAGSDDEDSSPDGPKEQPFRCVLFQEGAVAVSQAILFPSTSWSSGPFALKGGFIEQHFEHDILQRDSSRSRRAEQLSLQAVDLEAGTFEGELVVTDTPLPPKASDADEESETAHVEEVDDAPAAELPPPKVTRYVVKLVAKLETGQ